MTAHEKIAAEACQWCAKGSRTDSSGLHWDLPVGSRACTAPSADATIDRLAAERDTANNERNQMERLLKSESEYRSRQLMAADEINNRLRAENKRLREALEKAKHAVYCNSISGFCDHCNLAEHWHRGFPHSKDEYLEDHSFISRACNCWKAALAAPAQETRE